ncbi:MAG: polysaccharide deacetylase [Erysipelotrichaceae bacterium]|nr:polysaccharide deacetylase [Erysipelotrichaceae bacterium]
MKQYDRFGIAICLLLTVFSVSLFAENRKLLKDTETAEKENFEPEMKNALLQKEVSELTEECQVYEDIDTQIEEVKDQYFSLALELETKIVNGESEKKIAYLTFDDGPYYRSEKFLDVLEEYDVPATFFSLMKCAETGYADEDEFYDSIYRRILSSGHTLGNHTATHKLGSGGVYRSVDAFMDEIVRNRDFIEDRYGYRTVIMRFPGGSATSSKTPDIIPELRKIGYGYVDWNSATGDGGKNQAPEVFRDNVLNNTNGRKILVVLMHDYAQNTLIALPEIIEGLQKQGYIFLPLFYESSMVKK